MTYNKHRRLAGTVRYLPEVFTVQPTSDYQAFAPDSAKAMMQGAWSQTAEQMHEAVVLTVFAGPSCKYHVHSHYALPKGVETYLLDDESSKKDWCCHP